MVFLSIIENECVQNYTSTNLRTLSLTGNDTKSLGISSYDGVHLSIVLGWELHIQVPQLREGSS
jgi:hypothetical protein